MKFILASKSPRRKEILNKLNLKFRVIPSNVDESSIDTTINPIDYCMQLAELKSSNISLKYSNDINISFLEPIEPGKDKNVFINDLETKIYSSIDNLN